MAVIRTNSVTCFLRCRLCISELKRLRAVTLGTIQLESRIEEFDLNSHSEEIQGLNCRFELSLLKIRQLSVS